MALRWIKLATIFLIPWSKMFNYTKLKRTINCFVCFKPFWQANKFFFKLRKVVVLQYLSTKYDGGGWFQPPLIPGLPGGLQPSLIPGLPGGFQPPLIPGMPGGFQPPPIYLGCQTDSKSKPPRNRQIFLYNLQGLIYTLTEPSVMVAFTAIKNAGEAHCIKHAYSLPRPPLPPTRPPPALRHTRDSQAINTKALLGWNWQCSVSSHNFSHAEFLPFFV